MFELVQTSERQPVSPGFATQCVVATALQKSLNEKNNSLAVIFVVRPQGLEPWTH